MTVQDGRVEPGGTSAVGGPDSPSTCRSCNSTRVMHVAMELTDGSPVDLVSCLDCETRTWSTMDGEVLAISEVLDRARKSR